jgi:hypothetical protein
VPQLDRDRIWWTAWACVPLAALLNWWVAGDFERGLRISGQADVYATAGIWREAASRYEAAARARPDSALLAFNTAASHVRAGAFDIAACWNAEALRRDGGLAQALEAAAVLKARGAHCDREEPPARAPRPS